MKLLKAGAGAEAISSCPWADGGVPFGADGMRGEPPQVHLRFRYHLTFIRKVLEDANIKLASVATDVLGASGLAMPKALVAGEIGSVVLRSRPGSLPRSGVRACCRCSAREKCGR